MRTKHRNNVRLKRKISGQCDKHTWNIQILMYYCSVRNPHFRKDTELIEGIQRRATKLVKDVEHLHYNDRLEHLGLKCLIQERSGVI